MQLLHYPDGNLVGLAGTTLAWLGLGGAMFGRRKEAQSAPQKRDTRSVMGLVVQGLGGFAIWFGPMRFEAPQVAHAWIVGGAETALAFAGLALFFWARATMGRNWSLVARTRGDSELTQNGPFALMRHPIYVAIFVMFVATAFAIGHVINLVVGLPLYVIGTLMRVDIEERLLRETFPSYGDYALRVKRFIPGVW